MIKQIFFFGIEIRIWDLKVLKNDYPEIYFKTSPMKIQTLNIAKCESTIFCVTRVWKVNRKFPLQALPKEREENFFEWKFSKFWSQNVWIVKFNKISDFM